MSRIRTNLITNRMANGAPTVSNGLVISGVTTVTTLDLNGDLDVDGHLNADNVSIAGVCTATSFVGSGANLTSLPAANLTGTVPTARLGSGTASSSTFLRGDSTFAAPPTPAISAIANDAVSRVLTTDGDGTATAHSEVKIETVSGNKRLSINRGTGSTEVPLLVRRTDASGIVAEFSNSGGYGVYIGQNGATGEGYIRTATGQPMVFTTNSGSGIANERLRISSSGKVGINSTSPQQALDVKGSINGGSVNQPFLRFHDSAGRQRNTKHYFKCVKGGTTTFDILTVDLNQNFHQALIILYYGARIQNVSDSVTYPVHKIIGVNRFNGGSIQFTSHTVVQNSNASTHANIDAVATSSTNYRIRLTYSGTAGGSSFCCGSVEIIGVGSGDDGAFYSLAHAHGLLA